eukprot:453614-Alexandrium_andersonii.AAC.1
MFTHVCALLVYAAMHAVKCSTGLHVSIVMPSYSHATVDVHVTMPMPIVHGHVQGYDYVYVRVYVHVGASVYARVCVYT